MTPAVEERPIYNRVPARLSFSAQRVREVKFREVGVRFITGALTSIAAGGVTLALGSRVGGILLAFPAIALLLATAAWFGGAIVAYLIAWFR